MSADESITSLSEAVAELGALPMPVGPGPQALSAAEIRLSQYGEQRGTYGNASEKALHHIALDLRKELSDQREYEQRLREQHDLDVAELNRLRARVTELEALTPAAIQTCRKCGAGYTYGEPCSSCAFKARMAAELQARGLEGEHYLSVHHDYRLGHDLPETGGV